MTDQNSKTPICSHTCLDQELDRAFGISPSHSRDRYIVQIWIYLEQLSDVALSPIPDRSNNAKSVRKPAKNREKKMSPKKYHKRYEIFLKSEKQAFYLHWKIPPPNFLYVKWPVRRMISLDPQLIIK